MLRLFSLTPIPMGLDAEHKALALKQAKIVGKMTFGQALAIFNVEAGVRYDNPAKAKEVRRARVRQKELRLPEPDQFVALVNDLRNAGGGFSKRCADAIEFFAYAGPRLGEAAKIFGRDCNFTKGEIIIRGDAETGTKNWECVACR